MLPALGFPAAFASAYWIWIAWCYERNGFYPYPLLDAVSERGRALVFAGSAVTMAASTLALKWVYSRFNGHLGQETSVPGDFKAKTM